MWPFSKKKEVKKINIWDIQNIVTCEKCGHLIQESSALYTLEGYSNIKHYYCSIHKPPYDRTGYSYSEYGSPTNIRFFTKIIPSKEIYCDETGKEAKNGQ